MEAYDFLGFLRMVVFGPLLHIKNGNLPTGVRKVEAQLIPIDFEHLRSTIPAYTASSILESLESSVTLYRKLRDELYSPVVIRHTETEEKVMVFFKEIAASVLIRKL